jgi:glycosyltransferase involved in cell wall biosynthesis
MLKKIKAFIPNSWKYPLWWLFRSPQRKFGWKTLWKDIYALTAFCFYRFFRFKKLKPVTICTGIYNRTDTYLKGFINSINKAQHKDLIELSVFDCGSIDVVDLEREIRQHWKGKMQFGMEKRKFTRTFSFNKAVEQCTSDIIFICDADMTVPEDIVAICNHYTSHRLVWYPIVFYVEKDMPPIISKDYGHWMQDGGKGMLACRKQEFMKVGRLNESFTEWGREDDELWERFMKAGYAIIRNRQDGLIHNWHPSNNPKYRDKAE